MLTKLNRTEKNKLHELLNQEFHLNLIDGLDQKELDYILRHINICIHTYTLNTTFRMEEWTSGIYEYMDMFHATMLEQLDV